MIWLLTLSVVLLTIAVSLIHLRVKRHVTECQEGVQAMREEMSRIMKKLDRLEEFIR